MSTLTAGDVTNVDITLTEQGNGNINTLTITKKPLFWNGRLDESGNVRLSFFVFINGPKLFGENETPYASDIEKFAFNNLDPNTILFGCLIPNCQLNTTSDSQAPIGFDDEEITITFGESGDNTGAHFAQPMEIILTPVPFETSDLPAILVIGGAVVIFHFKGKGKWRN